MAIEKKKELGVGNKKVIGHIGRFNEQKNHFFLIKIFKRLAEMDSTIHLILVGDGNLKSPIESEVNRLGLENRVNFLGLRDDIPEILQVVDIFLFPSLYEGLPLTMIEAQAAGIKIVASNTISKEADITGLVTFCSLEDNEQHWADTVLENLDYNKKNTYQKIVEHNYDILKNAKLLQQFYLNNSN